MARVVPRVNLRIWEDKTSPQKPLHSRSVRFVTVMTHPMKASMGYNVQRCFSIGESFLKPCLSSQTLVDKAKQEGIVYRKTYLFHSLPPV